MSNLMTAAAHEPIVYLDSILNEEEKRCDTYSHQWRNFTISRSGRFKSKNKKREMVDGRLFDCNNAIKDDKSKIYNSGNGNSNVGHANGGGSHSSYSSYYKEQQDKNIYRQTTAGPNNPSTKYHQPATNSSSSSSSSSSSANARAREKVETYKSFYETNL